MREIKFRAKRLDTGEWVYGDLIYPPSGTAIIMIYIALQYRVYDKRTYVVDNDTICQFTGLTDKNGEEIYEGDILLCHGKYTFKVIWMNCSFIAKGKVKEIYNTVGIGNFFPAEIEVIGNIHDNPELMKGGTK